MKSSALLALIALLSASGVALIKITDNFSLVPSAKISYGTSYYGVDGFNNVLVKLSAPFAVSKPFTIAPFIAASFAIDSLSDLGVDDYLVGGAMLTFTF